jgi:hypothetical protein
MTLIEDWRATEPDRPPALWSVRLTSEHRVAVVDLLLRLPDGGYVPVLIRGPRTTDPGAGARLTPLADMATAFAVRRAATPARSSVRIIGTCWRLRMCTGSSPSWAWHPAKSSAASSVSVDRPRTRRGTTAR